MAGIRIQLDVTIWELLCEYIKPDAHWKLHQAKEQIQEQIAKATAGVSRQYAPNKLTPEKQLERLGVLSDVVAIALEQKLGAGLPIPEDMLLPLMEWASMNGKDELASQCNWLYMESFANNAKKFAEDIESEG